MTAAPGADRLYTLISFRSFAREAHRRSLWQVLTAYLVGAWIGYEVIQGLTEGLGLPSWLPAFAIIIFIIGLPIVLATAFVQEGLPAAQRGDPTLLPEAVAERPPRRRTGLRGLLTWRNAVIGGVVAFAIWGMIAAGWLLLGGELAGSGARPHSGETATAAAATGLLSLASQPPGAEVGVARIEDGTDPSQQEKQVIGRTPLAGYRLASGEYLVELSAAGFNPLSFLVVVDSARPVNLARRLVPSDPGTAGMVHVSQGPSPVSEEGLIVPAFLIDRHEVTNSEYLEFVAAGGYEDAELWPATLLIDGESVPWADGIDRLVDRSGLPGPRNWSGGTFPEGKAGHPVVSISWYEAAAYARWTDKKLPTWDQWWRAALGDGGIAYPWGDDPESADERANFGLMGTEPVGSHALGVSPFGVHDMAGNVKEWLAARGESERRPAVGGSYKAPLYTFLASHAETFDPAFADVGLGFRCVKDVAESN